MDAAVERDPVRGWKFSLGLFAGLTGLGIGTLAMTAGTPTLSFGIANLGAGLVLIGVLGKAICGAALWTAVEQ